MKRVARILAVTLAAVLAAACSEVRGWIHWMAANIEESTIPADYSRTAGSSAVQGMNDFKTIGYGGPTPPKDHTYQITAYALDAAVDLNNGFSKADFEKALKGHVLAQVSVKGVYKK
jgi:Raf kinase inhibitor-like YbhB/YbcL family protein